MKIKRLRGISEAIALIAAIGVAMVAVGAVAAYMLSQGQVLQRDVRVEVKDAVMILNYDDISGCHDRTVWIRANVKNVGSTDITHFWIRFPDRQQDDFIELDNHWLRAGDSRMVEWRGWWWWGDNCVWVGDTLTGQIFASRDDDHEWEYVGTFKFRVMQ